MIFKNHKTSLKITTLFMALVMMAMVILPSVPSFAAEDTAAYNVKAEAMIQNVYNKYMEDGKVALSSNTELDGYAIYVLNKANVNVLSWDYKGTTVEEQLDALIADAIVKEVIDKTTVNAKQLANLYVAALSSDKTEEAKILLDNLLERQNTSVEGGFVDGDYSEYTNLPVFDLLAMEGKLNLLKKPAKAFDYMENLNPTTSEFPDFMSINQTARILKGFKDQLNKTSLTDLVKVNLDWIKTNQAADGSFNAGGGDAVTNTSEALWTMKSAGTNETFKAADIDNAIKYLVEKDTFANIGANIWALKTLVANGAKPNFKPSVNPGDDVIVKEVTVKVAVMDDNGLVIYGPKSLTLKSDDKFGLTGLSSLDHTDLDYTANADNSFVESIKAISNKGLDGWMYAVNGVLPEVAAVNKTLVDGDEVLWYYSKSAASGVPAFPGKGFTDLGTNMNWAKEAIEALAARGIITGVGDNKFEPGRPITRAEFSKIVTSTLELENVVYTGGFSDVTVGKWYADPIATMVKNGLAQGYPNGTFNPNANITRNEVAKVIHSMQKEVAPSNAKLSFTDSNTVPAWANNSVAYAVEKALITGYPDNTFKGQNPMTRAEVAVVLYRYIKMMGL